MRSNRSHKSELTNINVFCLLSLWWLGLTTEQFIEEIASRISAETEAKDKKQQLKELNLSPPKRSETITPALANVDMEMIKKVTDSLPWLV